MPRTPPVRASFSFIFPLTLIFLEDIMYQRKISSLTTDNFKSEDVLRIISGIIPAKSLFRNILPATLYSSKIWAAMSP